MAAEPGPGFPDTRADASDPFDAKALADRAWLAALPDELAAQWRVMAGLADRCEAWPLATSLLVGCSLGRAADALSDMDAALGVDTPCGAVGAGRAGAVEAMVAAALPELGALVDVLRHRTGPADQWVQRIFAQFAGSTQLDLTVVAEAQIQGAAAAAAPWTSSRCTRHPPRRAPRNPDAWMPAAGGAPRGEPQAAYAVTGEQVRE